MGGADFPGDANRFPIDSAPEPDDPFRSGFETPGEPPLDLSPRPFQFTGSASEYFRIWIVNLMLSVATLGIYSAWAKVRRLRYFYGHTSLDGSVFGYHASPIAILKGRLISYGVVLTLGILGQVAPLGVYVLYLPLIALMPMILVRGLRFRARNSSYRGIRFAFDGQTSEAYLVFLGFPVAVPFTLGLSLSVRDRAAARVRHRRLTPRPVDVPVAAPGVAGLSHLRRRRAVRDFALRRTSRDDGGRAADRSPRRQPGRSGRLQSDGALRGPAVLPGRGAFSPSAFEPSSRTWRGSTRRSTAIASGAGWRSGGCSGITSRTSWLSRLTLGLAVPWARIRLARYRAKSLTLLPARTHRHASQRLEHR